LLVNHGGKGANQAVAARRLGAEVRFVACVGDDASGRDIRAALQAEGVGVDGVMVTREAATGTALIVVDQQGRNQIVVAPGANWRLSAEHVARARRISPGRKSFSASSRRRSTRSMSHWARRGDAAS
jgi:ribokinase